MWQICAESMSSLWKRRKRNRCPDRVPAWIGEIVVTEKKIKKIKKVLDFPNQFDIIDYVSE